MIIFRHDNDSQHVVRQACDKVKTMLIIINSYDSLMTN